MSKTAWVTLATNDSYSLGALVLAYSLKRSGTKHQLAILITPGVSQPMREKLQTVFDLVQLVNVLDSEDAANLALLARPELGVTFTKIHCWRLTQYNKCVFLDADILVLQNSDELFDRDEFSAAPDVGWPDCFNSGVFVFKPNLDTFAKLTEFAIKKGSFDGGDQGLLNSFFSDWSGKDISKHLPFIYNTCSTACYSYLPAFKQFGRNVKILHFIGQLKPWLINFDSTSKTAYTPQEYQHLAQFIQMWWDLFCTEIHPKLSGDMNKNKEHQPGETRWYENPEFLYIPPTFIPPDPTSNQEIVFVDPWEVYYNQQKEQEEKRQQQQWQEQYQQQQQQQRQEQRHHEYQHYAQHHEYRPDSHSSQPTSFDTNQNQYIQENQSYQDPGIQEFHQQQHIGSSNTDWSSGNRPNNDEHKSQNVQYFHESTVHSSSHRPDHVDYHHHQHHVHDQQDHHHQQQHVHDQQDHHRQHHVHDQQDHHHRQHHVHDQQDHHHREHHIHHQQDHHQQQQPQHIHDQEDHHHDSITQSSSEHKHSEEFQQPQLSDHSTYTTPQSTHPSSHEQNTQNQDYHSNEQNITDNQNDDCTSQSEEAGLAGALAQIQLGAPRSTEQTAYEESMRRQCWESGNIDYLGKDSFDNIWKRITQTLEFDATQSGEPTRKDRSPTPQPEDLAVEQRKQVKIGASFYENDEDDYHDEPYNIIQGIRQQTTTTTTRTEIQEQTICEVTGDGRNVQKIVKTYPADESEIVEEYESTEVDGKVTSVKHTVTGNENQSKTTSNKTTLASKQSVEQQQEQIEQRVVTEVTADGRTIQKIIKTYPGQVTETIEETETTQIGDEKTVKHSVVEKDAQPLPVEDKNKSLFPVDQPVVIIPGHQKIEFDAATNTKIVTEKTTTGYQQTITTVTAEGKTITKTKTFFDPIEIPGETVEEEETVEETVIEPEVRTETTTITTTSVEPVVVSTQGQATKVTKEETSSKITTASATETMKTNIAAEQVDETITKKITDVKDQTSTGVVDQQTLTDTVKTTDKQTETNIIDVTDQTAVTKTTTTDTKNQTSATDTTDKTSVTNVTTDTKDQQNKTSTALVKKSTDDTRIDQIVATISDDSEIEATLTQETTKSSKVTKEANKVTQEQGRKFEQNVEIVASAPTSTTVIKEQVQKEQKKQTTVSSTGQLQNKMEQTEVREEYEETQSSQVTTTSGKNTKEDTTTKALTHQQQQQHAKNVSTKELAEQTNKSVTQKQQQQTDKKQTSEASSVVKKSTETTVQESVNKATTAAVTTTDNKAITNKNQQISTKETGENKKIVTTSKDGEVTTEEIRYFPGGREHTYKTVRLDGTVKTSSKTFYDPVPVPVDPNTNQAVIPKPSVTGKNEVKTTIAENGDVTTEEIRFFSGGREHIYHTVCADGTTKSASKTFYDTVPVESQQEQTEEIEEYEEVVEESSTTATSSTTSTKRVEEIKGSLTSVHSTGSTDSAKKKLQSAPVSKQAPSKGKEASAAVTTPVPPPRKKEVKKPTKGK